MRALTLLAVLAFCGAAMAAEPSLPPGEGDAKARLEKSPRHGEYIDIAMGEGKKPTRAYVVYPEVKDKAPVVIVIQEIYGLSDWIKGVTDQLAADGFIAIAPDFLSGRGPDGGGTEAFKSRDDVVKEVRALKPDDVKSILDATVEHVKKIPSANGKFATVGYCWGGSQSYLYATQRGDLSAAVVYYGTSPASEPLEKIKAPVLGLYGADDARVNATIDPAKKRMAELKKTYEVRIYEGAGHGFLRQQDGRNGANLKAAQQAWPETVAFLKKAFAQ